MRRLWKILLILWIALFVTLIAYAFVPQVKAFMDSTIGPPVQDAFGGMITAITGSMIWKQYIVPFPNQLIIGALILGFPIAFLVHKSFNRVRGVFVRSADRETGRTIMTEPVSTPAYAPPVTHEETKKEPAPAQTPPPQEKPKEEAAP